MVSPIPIKQGKKLTPIGINRVLWKLLVAVGGKFVVSVNELDNFKPDCGIKVDYHPDTDTFVLKCIRVEPEPKIVEVNRNLILPNG